MPTKSYGSTTVPVAKSQAELRSLLQKFGAQQFTFGEGRDWAGVEFVHADHMVRVRCPLQTPNDKQVQSQSTSSHRSLAEATTTLLDREAMRIWRVLVWVIKARLVSVEEGLETFEQAFLSNLVDPSSDRTLWEAVRQPIESGAFQLGGAGLKALGRGN